MDSKTSHFREIVPGLYCFEDCCNGYIKCAETLAALKPNLILGQHAQEIPNPTCL
ncbi:hypothetical protein H8D79_00905 [PVC group bacterium]|nr:hypothetical protein [PVC group bacterium]